MKNFIEYAPDALNLDPIPAIGGDWMLITAKKKDGSVNTMTASWGGTGVLWNKPVAFLFVRPQRFTREFLDDSDFSTASFFDRRFRPALTLCGRKSGRDCRKIEEAGLTVRSFGPGVSFEEAHTVLLLKKLYVGRLDRERFLDPALVSAHYPSNDFHFVYVCEIVSAFRECAE